MTRLARPRRLTSHSLSYIMCFEVLMRTGVAGGNEYR